MTATTEFEHRAAFAKGQIMEALGNLAAVTNIPEVHRAERALRIAIAELDGKARAAQPGEAVGTRSWPPPAAAS